MPYKLLKSLSLFYDGSEGLDSLGKTCKAGLTRSTESGSAMEHRGASLSCGRQVQWLMASSDPSLRPPVWCLHVGDQEDKHMCRWFSPSILTQISLSFKTPFLSIPFAVSLKYINKKTFYILSLDALSFQAFRIVDNLSGL